MDSNPYFNAGFGLAALGVGYRVVGRFSKTLMTIAKKKLLISLEVTNTDPAFRWILNYVQTSPGLEANHVTVNTLSENAKMPFLLTPSPGLHYMFLKNRFFLVERIRETGALNLNTGVPFESVKFTTFGRDKNVLLGILNDSRERAVDLYRNQTVVYRSKAYLWEQFGNPKRKRPLESVILPAATKDGIVADISEFLASADWYLGKGIPYRRTYLFQGTPGSGKTSFIAALAGKFDMNLAMVNLNENVTDDQFAQAMSCVPKDSVVVMEDIDAVFTRREIAADGFRHGISFSGLLNVLDGVLSSEGRIIFMTTNHLERLDQALIRPGRVDVIEFFGAADEVQAEELFYKFFPLERTRGAGRGRLFAEKYKGKSMAFLQGVLLANKDDAHRAATGESK